jgi:hypothetical protein
MKNKLIISITSLAIVFAVIMGFLATKPVSAAVATTSIHIVKYNTAMEIIGEATVSIAAMQAMAVQGDGATHYYTQGPTFDSADMWDPNETFDLDHGGDSLKDKGALRGTALKDLCELVGGMAESDQVTVMATDGYNDTFDYANAYNDPSDPEDPTATLAELSARQGQIVITWEKDGAVSGSGWTDGMMLAFFPEASTARSSDTKIIFGHEDMRLCLPPAAQHFYWDGQIKYPSVHGAYIKWVNQISIFEGGANNWSITQTGARNEMLTQNWFENCIACHTDPEEIPSANPADFTYTDGNGDVWSGLPLWYVCALVDDTTNVHGAGCFNDGLFYNIKVIGGSNNYSYTFPSTSVARNNSYLLANKLNDEPLTEDKFPLKLVSPTFTNGGPSIAQISRIELLDISTTPPSGGTTPSTIQDWPLQMVGASNYSWSQETFESCLSCHSEDVVDYVDEEINTWRGLPLWMLTAWVDDAVPHLTGSFNDTLAATNYRIKITAADGYYYDYYSAATARNNNIIVANQVKWHDMTEFVSLPLNTGATHPAYPLKVTGSGTASGDRIGGIVQIRLMLATPTPTPTPTAQPNWDLNNDNVCNIGDVVKVGLKWGMTGTAGWIPEDLNKDGVINIGDVVVLGLHWGETW